MTDLYATFNANVRSGIRRAQQREAIIMRILRSRPNGFTQAEMLARMKKMTRRASYCWACIVMCMVREGKVAEIEKFTGRSYYTLNV